jgi:hypothetical protein
MFIIIGPMLIQSSTLRVGSIQQISHFLASFSSSAGCSFFFHKEFRIFQAARDLILLQILGTSKMKLQEGWHQIGLSSNLPDCWNFQVVF